VPTPIPYQSDHDDFGSVGWMEVRSCQRRSCDRIRVDYADMSAVTYYRGGSMQEGMDEDPIYDLIVVRSN
jgi:hypothetical protein